MELKGAFDVALIIQRHLQPGPPKFTLKAELPEFTADRIRKRRFFAAGSSEKNKSSGGIHLLVFLYMVI